MLSDEEQLALEQILDALFPTSGGMQEVRSEEGVIGLFESLRPGWDSLVRYPPGRRVIIKMELLGRLTGLIPQGIHIFDQASGGRVPYWRILSRDIEDLQRRIVPLPAQQAEETVDKFYFDKWLYGEGLGVYRPGG